VDVTDSIRLTELAHTLHLSFKTDASDNARIYLDDEDISDVIRSEWCGQHASTIGIIPEVRAALLERQRAFARLPGLVTDGRDMGTVVFPKAVLKIFLTASQEERALRRHLQLKKSGNDVSLAQVVEELAKRDARDTYRTHAPLVPAEDAHIVDTTGLTVAQVFDIVLKLAENGFGQNSKGV
jgi:cytidylate kinase